LGLPSYSATGFDATSASISFTGSGVVVFGTVVNGTGNQPMNVSVQLDSDRAFVPTYVPGSSISKGFDYNNQIVKNTSLPFQLHTLTVSLFIISMLERHHSNPPIIQLSITGPTPFFVRLFHSYTTPQIRDQTYYHSFRAFFTTQRISLPRLLLPWGPDRPPASKCSQP